MVNDTTITDSFLLLRNKTKLICWSYNLMIYNPMRLGSEGTNIYIICDIRSY